MSLELFAQLLVNALAIGGIYIVIAVGLDLIIRTTRILNFAHGAFYMIGAYTFWFTYSMLRLNIGLGLILTALVLVLLGGISYLAVFNIVQRRFTPTMPLSSKLLMSAMASVGLMMIIEGGTVIGFGAEERGIPSIFPQMIAIGDVSLPLEKLVTVLLSLLLLIGLFLLLYKTRLGKSMRAVSLDALASSLQGINTTWVYLVAFILGCGLAGLAGAIIAPTYAITLEMGKNVLFIAMLTIVVGGIGSYKGTVLGGLIVGAVLSFGYHFFGGLSQVFLFIVVIVVLIFRPAGFFGERYD